MSFQARIRRIVLRRLFINFIIVFSNFLAWFAQLLFTYAYVYTYTYAYTIFFVYFQMFYSGLGFVRELVSGCWRYAVFVGLVIRRLRLFGEDELFWSVVFIVTVFFVLCFCVQLGVRELVGSCLGIVGLVLGEGYRFCNSLFCFQVC